ncbi:hypothetical protein [Deinococcus sp.]|uniref:hypothetical protein n=1 Tax=Deinococcus sp. TaxID=47478 RepID=UPI003B595EA9
MTPPRSSPLPPWSPSASALRLLVTLGLLAVVGTAFVGSVRRLDAQQVQRLQARSAQVRQPLDSASWARVLDISVSPELGQTLGISAADAPEVSAQLSASREGDLMLEQTRQGDVLKLRLAAAEGRLPLAIPLDGSSIWPGKLDIRLPTALPLRLSLTRVAESSVLDLRRVQLERLNYVGGGSLNLTLPERGPSQTNLQSSGGVMTVTLLPGASRATLKATSKGGDLLLNVPASARVTLRLQLSASLSRTFSDLPKRFEYQPTGRGSLTRIYIQRGQPGGSQLTADLKLDNGLLVVNGGSP